MTNKNENKKGYRRKQKGEKADTITSPSFSEKNTKRETKENKRGTTKRKTGGGGHAVPQQGGHPYA